MVNTSKQASMVSKPKQSFPTTSSHRRRLVKKTTVTLGTIEARLSIGDVVGEVLDSNVCHFSGLPFAAPPVGNLRWKRPQPPKPWCGQLDATRRRPERERTATPIQFVGDDDDDDDDSDDEPNEHSDPTWQPPQWECEDCLYASVWAPVSSLHTAPKKADAPVMVYVYGGGLCMGAATDADSIATDYARRGCVAVAYNYRVGPLGWFQPRGGDANCGLWDTVAILRWVQKEARAFGGDPNNVTMMGQSAGADVVFWSCTSPIANRLFHRAIIESYGSQTWTVEQLREVTDEFATVACATSSSLCDMQKLTVNDIKVAAEKTAYRVSPNTQPAYRFETYPKTIPGAASAITAGGNLYLPQKDKASSFSAVIDGELLPMQPLNALAAGVASHLCIIVGSSRFETSGPSKRVDLNHALAWEFAGAPRHAGPVELQTIANFLQKAYRKEWAEKKRTPKQSVALEQATQSLERAKERFVRNLCFSDLSYAAFSYLVAERLALPGACRNVYYFEFTGSNGRNSEHGTQFQYTMGPWFPEETDQKLRETWHDAYARFMHVGNPNTSAITAAGGWLSYRPYSGGGRALMRWDTKRGPRLSMFGHRDRHGLRAVAALYEYYWKLERLALPRVTSHSSTVCCWRTRSCLGRGKRELHPKLPWTSHRKPKLTKSPISCKRKRGGQPPRSVTASCRRCDDVNVQIGVVDLGVVA